MRLLLLLVVFSLPAFGDSIPAARVEPAGWVHVMEASVGRTILQHREPAAAHFFSWLGWVLALTFFGFLLHLHLKMHRAEQMILRGKRNMLVFPPAFNRRRRPR